MMLRGVSRLAAAAAATTLLLGAFGAPAFAEEGEVDPGVPILSVEGPLAAADAKTKGCEGIGDGAATVGTDGWLYGKPAGENKVEFYLFVYLTGLGEDMQVVPLVLDGKGMHGVDVDLSELTKSALTKSALTKSAGNADRDAVAKALIAAAGAGDGDGDGDGDGVDEGDIPLKDAPAGVSGALTETGGWVKTPAGWLILTGFVDTDPDLDGGTFDLIRVCLPAAAPQPSTSTGHPTGGGSLPVTGTNVWVLSGVGGALIVAGVVLFLAYRRRQSVKFVA